MIENLCPEWEAGSRNVYAECNQKVREALADLPGCKVRADAGCIASYIARRSPWREGDFAFGRTIHEHPRFVRWCGATNAAGKPWTDSRVRSCLRALERVGYIANQTLDTICYHDPKRKACRDTPKEYRLCDAFRAILESCSVTISESPAVEVEAANDPLPPLESPAEVPASIRLPEKRDDRVTLAKASRIKIRDEALIVAVEGAVHASGGRLVRPLHPGTDTVIRVKNVLVVAWGKRRSEIIQKRRDQAEQQLAMHLAVAGAHIVAPSSRLAAHNAAKWRL